MLISIIYKGTSVDYAIENYTLNQYEKTYDESSSYYEKNILVCFVAYKDNDEYVLFNVVGDDIDYEIDRSFGGIGTSFGNAVNDNVPSRNYYGNLYFSLAILPDYIDNSSTYMHLILLKYWLYYFQTLPSHSSQLQSVNVLLSFMNAL